MGRILLNRSKRTEGSGLCPILRRGGAACTGVGGAGLLLGRAALWASDAYLCGYRSGLVDGHATVRPVAGHRSDPAVCGRDWLYLRRERKGKGGVATRAPTASYTSAGLLNLIIAVTFGWLAINRQSTTIWLLYPVVICAMQGAVWYALALIRRKMWLSGFGRSLVRNHAGLDASDDPGSGLSFLSGSGPADADGSTGYAMRRLSVREREAQGLRTESTADSGADTDPQVAREALAFVKALVDRGEQVQISGGLLLLSGGVLYGLQCLIHGLDMSGHIRLGALGHLINGVLPTLLFLIMVGVVLWRDRHKTHANAGSRAINAAFGGVGLANLFMNFVFGYAAVTQKMWLIWMLYPISLCALMGPTGTLQRWPSASCGLRLSAPAGLRPRFFWPGWWKRRTIC